MFRWLRVFLFIAALAAIFWCAGTIQLGSRTAFGHAYAWSKQYRSVRIAVSWLSQRYDALFVRKAKTGARPHASARSATDANQGGVRGRIESPATARRVALLESAAKEAQSPHASKPAPVHKTRIDERFSPRHRKGLDELVSSRVTRP